MAWTPQQPSARVFCREKPSPSLQVPFSLRLTSLPAPSARREAANGCTGPGLHWGMRSLERARTASVALHTPSADRPPAAPVQPRTADAQAHASHPGLRIPSPAAALLECIIDNHSWRVEPLWRDGQPAEQLEGQGYFFHLSSLSFCNAKDAAGCF